MEGESQDHRNSVVLEEAELSLKEKVHIFKVFLDISVFVEAQVDLVHWLQPFLVRANAARIVNALLTH